MAEEDIFDQIAPSKPSGDIFDSLSSPKKSTPLSKSTVNAQGQSTYMPSEAATPTPGASPFRQPAPPQPQPQQQAPEPPWWEIAARGIARQGLPTPGVPSTVQAYQQMKARGETPGIVPGTLKMISPAAAKAYQENKGAGPEILRILGSLLEPEQLTSFPQLAALGVSKPISRLAAGAFAANQASIARQKYLQGDPGAAVVQGLIGTAAAVPEVASRLRARGASTPAPPGEAATTPAPTATPVTAGEGQVPPTAPSEPYVSIVGRGQVPASQLLAEVNAEIQRVKGMKAADVYTEMTSQNKPLFYSAGGTQKGGKAGYLRSLEQRKQGIYDYLDLTGQSKDITPAPPPEVPPGTGIVARHGETPLNVKSPDAPEGYFRGFENPPLTENGQKQVAQSADVLKQKGVGTVYAGDLTRHIQSQDIIAQKTGATAVPPTPALRPLDLGDLNGAKITQEGNQRVLDAVLKNPDQPLPGSSESPNQWKQRVLGAWQDLQAQHANDPNPFSIVTSYRNVKLIEAWEAAGRPQDLSIDPKVFAEDHHPPGSLMQVSPGEPTKVISAPGESPHGISPPSSASAQKPDLTAEWQAIYDKSVNATVPFSSTLPEGQQPTAAGTFTRMAVRNANWTLADKYGIEMTPEEKVGTQILRGVETEGKYDATLQSKQKSGARENDVRTGEGGQAGPRGGVGQGPSDQGQVSETPGTRQTQEGQVETTGIAQRVHEARGAAGRIGEITPGQGTTPQEMIQKGRDAITAGADPQKVMQAAKTRGFASADEVAILRAQAERMAENTEAAVRQHGPGSPQDVAARRAETEWLKEIKPFSTEAHRLMVAHQAETEIGTGDIIEASRRGMPAVFTRLRQAFEGAKGREMSPAETAAIERHATDIAQKTADIQKKQAEVETAIEQSRPLKKQPKVTLPSDANGLRNYFANKYKDQPFIVKTMGQEAGGLRKPTPSGFTTPEVRAIWEYAKQNYIGMGNVEAGRAYRFNEVVNKVAGDLGLTPDQVMKAFTERKTVINKVDELFKMESDRRRAIQLAKTTIADADKSGFRKFLEKAWRFPSAEAVLGHGGVGMVTHAGPNIFRPSSWKAYWPSFAAQYKMTFNNAFHEKMMQNIEQGPDYAMKVRAGLAIEADKLYDNYQEYGKLLGALGRKGNQGMDALKMFRDKYFDLEWSKMSPDLKTPDMAKELADWVNGASGKGSLRTKEAGIDISKPAGATMFASSLEAARWKRVLGDPIKTAKTLADWKNATPEEQAIAKLRIRRAGEVTAVYMAALAANDGLLAAQDKKDRVNFTDPSKSDWLRFKDGNGRTLDVTGNALGPLRFMGQLADSLNPAPGFQKAHHGENRLEAAANATMRYARSKLNPQLGIAADIADQKNFTGKLMPFAENPKGRPQFTWGEYGAEHLPIPVAGAFREYYDTLQKEGVSAGQADAILNGIKVLPIELTGARIGTTPKEPESKTMPFKSLTSQSRTSAFPSLIRR